MALTSTDLCPTKGFFPLISLGEESVHNPLEMLSSTSYKAKTNEPKSANGTPTTCLVTLSCKLLKTICTLSLSGGLSMISTIFPCQREMNDETDSSVLCLRASSSLLDTSTTILNAYYLRTLGPDHPKSDDVIHPNKQTNVVQCHPKTWGKT